MDMNELRQQIDSIDDQLVQLFVERMNVAEKIGVFKKSNGIQMLILFISFIN